MNNSYSPTDIVEWSPSQMLEVYLHDPDDFLKIKETLSRIGVSSKRETNVLFQSCHILHKQGRYFIVHFKELFMLDGKPSTFMYEDRCRRNTIAMLLSDWNLLSIVDRNSLQGTTSLKQIKIISHRDKSEWDLRSKYSIGNVKKKS
jgi:hypothetical protein